MKKLHKLLAIMFATLCLLSFVACDGGNESSSTNSDLAKEMVKVIDNIVIITVDGDYFALSEETILLDYMNALKDDGAIDFTIKDGMVNAINGQENPVDFSKCWMLYSNDAEFSNESWGTVEVEDVVYFSAVLGAESLPIKDGKVYVWEFKSF